MSVRMMQLGRLLPVRKRSTLRLAMLGMGLLTIAVIWVTNQVLTERYSAATRSQAEVRLALFSGGLMGELRRSAIVPQLLARDPFLKGALLSGDFQASSQRLIAYRDEIGATRLMLMDADGRTVASSDRVDLGTNLRNEPFVVDALRSNSTVFTALQDEVGLPEFFYTLKIEQAGDLIGLIAVEVDLRKYERSWAGITEAVIVKDSEGHILLTTQSRWRGMTEEVALAPHSDRSPIVERLLGSGSSWTGGAQDVFLGGQALMRSEARVPFQGWQLVSFSDYAAVRERVNTVLAIEVMAFAICAAALFFFATLQADRRSAVLKRESDALKELNLLLQREIAERKRAEKNLEVAEQSLAQSSKLAALGEMSAAVSHELNQPLAAMKTYLAGARLLLSRRRIDEATSSFQRINDLIDRMATITRQLKSYAGKSNDILGRVDMRDALSGSIAMMAPQLRNSKIRVNRSQPNVPVEVLGDQVRLEQVIVNLLRNAVDATKSAEDPEIDVILSLGQTATLTVRDNGAGIAELDALFEPFYTTKAPGDGLGLGLAISSSIITDLGGRLKARNRVGPGAVFEVQLPLYGQDIVAAE